MSSSKIRVLLLSCGSFNPITNMHLRMFGEWCFWQEITNYFKLYFLCTVVHKM